MTTAKGTFNVDLQAQPKDDFFASDTLNRMTIDKQFRGELEAHSKGQMLSALSGVKGSAGYVAIEQVSGILAGKRGSFVLQHSATMTRGTPQQTITVVPDSATGELEGLTGTMVIDITEGKHFYTFSYSLPG